MFHYKVVIVVFRMLGPFFKKIDLAQTLEQPARELYKISAIFYNISILSQTRDFNLKIFYKLVNYAENSHFQEKTYNF